MNIKRLVARSISEVYGGISIALPIPTDFRVLMYHAIGTPALDDKLGIFSLSREKFILQMSLLSSGQFGQVMNFSKNTLQSESARLSITFDDGYLDNLEVAAPILDEFGFPFTVFVSSDFVRHHRKGFLSPSNLRDLSMFGGATIGSHGVTHRALTEFDDVGLNNELISSKKFLEDVIGKEVSSIAYPYGAANRRVRDAVKNAGYELGACSLAGANQAVRDPLMLARTEITSWDTNRIFYQKLRGSWDWCRWLKQDPLCN